MTIREPLSRYRKDLTRIGSTSGIDMITKYSKLHGAGATTQQLEAASKRLGIDPVKVRDLANDADPTPEKKFESWIVKQMSFQNIRLPEDASRVQTVLKDFVTFSNRKRLKHRDIAAYPKIHDLEAEIDSLKGDLQDSFSFDVQKYLSLPGVSLWGQNSEWLILSVTNAVSASKLADSTKWCTIAAETASYYIEEAQGLYVVFEKKGGKLIKYAQYTGDFTQFMDIQDKKITEFSDSLWGLLTKEGVSFELARKNPTRLFNYLAETLEISHDLNLSRSGLTALPEGLHVKGFLDVSHCPIQELPRDLVVDEALVIDHTQIKEIPEGIQIGLGVLSCKWLPITRIPPSIVLSHLDAGSCMFLTDFVTEPVMSYLRVTGAISKLPPTLKEVKRLFISGSSITEIPPGLEVNTLDISETPITELPAGTYQDVTIAHTKVKRILPGTVIEGSLYAAQSSLVEIAPDCKIEEALEIDMCWVKTLPDNLSLVSLSAESSHLQKIPDGLSTVLSCNVAGSAVKEIGHNVNIGSTLDLSRTAVTELPQDLTVGKTLRLNASKVVTIPEKFQDIYIEGWSEILKKDFADYFQKTSSLKNPFLFSSKKTIWDTIRKVRTRA